MNEVISERKEKIPLATCIMNTAGGFSFLPFIMMWTSFYDMPPFVQLHK